MLPEEMPRHVTAIPPASPRGGGAEITSTKCSARNIFARRLIMAPQKRCEDMAGAQYAMWPTSLSTSAVSTMTMASHGQPSRKQPSGPLLRHFLHPMHWRGSIWMRPNGGLSSSGTQNMQSSTGQYSTQAGDPAQPVQHSVITANSFGFFLRAVAMPFERGSNFCSSGTIPGAFTTSGALAISSDSTLSVKSLSAWFFRESCACYNARASDSPSHAHHVLQDFLQTPPARAPRRTRIAPLLHPAFPLLFGRYRLLRRAGPQLAVPRRLRLLLPRTACCLGRAHAQLSGISGWDLFSGWHGTEGGHAGASFPRPWHVRAGLGNRPSSGRGRFRCGARSHCSRCALAGGALPLYGELHRGAAHGSAGDIFHDARASDFFVASRNYDRSHCLQPRFATRGKKLVRGRARSWTWHARATGNAVASCGRSDRALAPLPPSRELEKAHGRDAVHGRWFAVAAGTLGRAQRREFWTGAVPRASLRGNVWRRSANRLLCLYENVDVSFSRCLSLHLQTARATDPIEKSSYVRSGFSRRIVTRRFPAGSLQP